MAGDKVYIIKNGGEVVQEPVGSGSGDMTKAVYDPNEDGIIATAQLDANVGVAISLAHSNILDHDGAAQDTAIAGKTTLAAVKADTDIADAITKKHSNGLDHDGTIQDTAIAGKEPANANIQTHVTSAHAPANAQKNSDITKGEIEAKLIGEIVSHTHPGGGGESEIVVVKVGDTANATANLADATGLSFTALANKTYIIEALIRYSTSAITVGIKLSASGPASPAFIAGLWDVNAAQGTPDGGAFNAYNVAVAASAAPFTDNNLARLHCVFRNGNNQGNFVIRFAAETTGTITIKDGSVLRYRQVD